MIAAVRVPPSACSTSQSMTIVFSPSALVSTTARSARPIRREISCVRPPIRPLTLSRSLRLLVARGSIAYSAVTQPLPLPVSQRGTPFVNDAVQSTFVFPKLISADPSAWPLQPRSIVIGRSWSTLRPSARTTGVGLGHGISLRWGRSMTPVCTSVTPRTSWPIRRLARTVKSSADAPVAS